MTALTDITLITLYSNATLHVRNERVSTATADRVRDHIDACHTDGAVRVVLVRGDRDAAVLRARVPADQLDVLHAIISEESR